MSNKNKKKESPVNRLLKWRLSHPEEYAQARNIGIRNSPNVKTAAAIVARKYWPATWKKLSRLPRFMATEQHIRALDWRMVSPANVVYRFKNLSYFIRENPGLFDSDDIVWTMRGAGRLCRAYTGLAALRPTSKRRAESWKGWRWSTETKEDSLAAEQAAGGKEE